MKIKQAIAYLIVFSHSITSVISVVISCRDGNFHQINSAILGINYQVILSI